MREVHRPKDFKDSSEAPCLARIVGKAGLKSLVVILGSSPSRITDKIPFISLKVMRESSSQLNRGFPPHCLVLLTILPLSVGLDRAHPPAYLR